MASTADGSVAGDRTAGRLLARRNWLLAVKEELAALSPLNRIVDRYTAVDPEFFLDCNYAANRPAVLCGELDSWPALKRWTPEYLRKAVGAAEVEFQGARVGNERFELDKAAHRRRMPFDQFISLVSEPEAANDAYLTAFNSRANIAALAPLTADLGQLDKLLHHRAGELEAMLWIGGAGTFTPLHHDLTNNLLVQLVGRKRVILVPAEEAARIPSSTHVFSDAADLTDEAARARFPILKAVSYFDLTLEPGEILFIPIGWWHQVTALDFSASATYTNFRWRNDWYASFPG